MIDVVFNDSNKIINYFIKVIVKMGICSIVSQENILLIKFYFINTAIDCRKFQQKFDRAANLDTRYVQYYFVDV